METNPIYIRSGDSRPESSLNSVYCIFQTCFLASDKLYYEIWALPHAILSTEVLSTSLGELRTSYPPADEIVLSSKPKCVSYLPKHWSDVDNSLLVIRRVSSSGTASPTASRPVVVAVAAVVDIVRRRIEEIGDGSKNVKLSSG